jgi:uncharacterized protein (DUF433 family)
MGMQSRFYRSLAFQGSSAFFCQLLAVTLYAGIKGLTMQSVITRDQNILGGEPVFRGTRVPFKVLTDYLEGGETLDEFLEQYPSVTRELAIAAIEEARASLVSNLK